MSGYDDFLDDAAGDSNPHLKRGCGVGKLLTELGDDADQIKAALDRPEITATAIEAALRRRSAGKAVPSAFTIGRHRRGVCKCAYTETS